MVFTERPIDIGMECAGGDSMEVTKTRTVRTRPLLLSFMRQQQQQHKKTRIENVESVIPYLIIYTVFALLWEVRCK